MATLFTGLGILLLMLGGLTAAVCAGILIGYDQAQEEFGMEHEDPTGVKTLVGIATSIIAASLAIIWATTV